MVYYYTEVPPETYPCYKIMLLYRWYHIDMIHFVPFFLNINVTRNAVNLEIKKSALPPTIYKRVRKYINQNGNFVFVTTSTSLYMKFMN